MFRDRVNDPEKFCEFRAGFKEQFYFDCLHPLEGDKTGLAIDTNQVANLTW